MIKAARIERFRGLRDTEIDGIGRVNLIVGRNDCGKTALLEALELADDTVDSAHVAYVQQRRRSRKSKGVDFDRFWRPLFWNHDADRGFVITVREHNGVTKSVEVRKGSPPAEVVRESLNEEPNEPLDFDLAKPGGASWRLEVLATINGKTRSAPIHATSGELRMPPTIAPAGSTWISSSASMEKYDIRLVSYLKETGRDGDLLRLLRELDPRLVSIDLLAPTGDIAALYVRLDDGTPPLALAMMGEGFQRCLQIGATAAGDDWPVLFIDEIENGIHHLVLEPLWTWIAAISRMRNLQIFATTHSEECIQAACRSFARSDDDGLRVVRLDRVRDATKAVLYDRHLVEVAVETGVEIRG